MFSEIHYNKIQIYVIKIFEMTHPQKIANKFNHKFIKIIANTLIKIRNFNLFISYILF